MVTLFFLAPLHLLGPHRPVVSWLAFAAGLLLVAVLLLVQLRYVLTGRGGTRPGWVIAGLMCLTVLLFASAYFVLARQPGEFTGLRTRVDALYFTVVTLATVGYGDITPTGQSARVLTILQILYSFVFLTAGATALTRQLRRRFLRHDRARPARERE
ncbi:potassium channel family protein [Streptomyces sp. NPDC047123]|uniref:potassium channel family protein n=1 Tax=Streptomyces sp. NPDC047123 TaxID=3155622 RepID=UPI0033FB63D4